MRRRWKLFGGLLLTVWLAALLSACSLQHSTEPQWLTLVTTTELDQSGLLDQLLPPFEQQTGVHVKRVPVSTATALQYASNAGVDVVLLPAGPAFDNLAGPAPANPPYQAKPFPTPTVGTTPSLIPPALPNLLYNERQVAFWDQLVILAPLNDTQQLKVHADALTCLKAISSTNNKFYGADPAIEPGLAQAEQRLWTSLGRYSPTDRGTGYQQIPGDFDAILKKAAADQAYTIVPLSTYLANTAAQSQLQIGFQNDKALYLPYEIAVPNNSPTQAQDRDIPLARTLLAFLTGPQAQTLIANFTNVKNSAPPYRPYYFPVYLPPL